MWATQPKGQNADGTPRDFPRITHRRHRSHSTASAATRVSVDRGVYQSIGRVCLASEVRGTVAFSGSHRNLRIMTPPAKRPHTQRATGPQAEGLWGYLKASGLPCQQGGRHPLAVPHPRNPFVPWARLPFNPAHHTRPSPTPRGPRPTHPTSSPLSWAVGRGFHRAPPGV